VYSDLAVIIAVGDLITVGLKCQCYVETSHTIVIFALNVSIL
jgi:hypothetical protein